MEVTSATWYQLLIFGGSTAVALLSTVCTASITPKRTYYPLLRIILAITAAIYAATAAGVWFGGAPNPYVRLLTIGTAVALLVISTVFIVRRNRLPQWVSMDWKGAVTEPINAAELDHCVLVTLSLVRHGAAAPELIGQLRAALDNWERQKRWAGVTLPGQIAARQAVKRAARQAHNAAREVAATELGAREREGE